MYAGGTILNWAGRVPKIDEIDEVSGRETIEVGQWDSTLEELRDDPEVEEAIVAIDSDPPPGPFVRSTPPPSSPPMDEAAERGEEQPRDAVVDYHEPPDVDPPPLTYAQVFEEDAGEASIRAPRAVKPSSLVPPASPKPTMLPWALLVLTIGCVVAMVAYWMSVADPVSVSVADPESVAESVPVPVAESVPVPVAESVPVAEPVTATEPEPVPAEVPVPEPVAAGEGAEGDPGGIYPETGVLDTYDAQLGLARRLKRGSRAVAAYRRAIELNPEGSAALAELARLMLARNHTRESAELAQRATAVDPSNSLAWITLGAARQMRGDRQGARHAYQNCAKLGKGPYVSECRAMLR
jgi:hypothetical protein